MPVLECTCGMVMSVSAAEPRSSCIRCKSAALKPLEQSAKPPRDVQRRQKRIKITPANGRVREMLALVVAPLEQVVSVY